MPDPVSIGLAAVGWGLSMAGWPLSTIISERIKIWLSKESPSLWARLMDLEGRISNLKRVLDEESQVNPLELKSRSIEYTIKKLKAAMYKAEDIIDSIDYHYLKTNIKGKSVETDSRRHKSSQNFGKSLEGELNKILKEIQTLIDEAHKNLPSSNVAPSRGGINNRPNNFGERGIEQRPPTDSQPPEKVFGRDEDRAKIKQLLRDAPADDEASSSTTKCYSLIGIHGMPGSGKTTLAQYVSKMEKEAGGGYFDSTIWIHVTEEFSVATIFSEILEQVPAGGQTGHHINLDALRNKLQAALKNKKFLLVLDDVWYDKSAAGQQKRDQLLGALNAGKRGSKILVTSREKEAAIAFGAETHFKISDLKEEHFMNMFMHYANQHTSNMSDNAQSGKYEHIGRQIAAKLQHSPLAARTIAGQLRGKLIDDWERALRCDLLKDVMGVLWWSYRQFDEHARKCFAYLSMFPRRYVFWRNELVHLWMAQGFLTTTDGTEDMEDIGNSYLNVLLSCSFIQPRWVSKDAFLVHDLVHDLATRVAGNDCFSIIEGMDPGRIPDDVRHLFMECFDPKVFREQVLKLVELRTIFVGRGSVQEMTDKVWDKLFMKLKKLRAVRVPGRDGKVPENIGELEHLRYLYFSYDFLWHTSEESFEETKLILPSTFGRLYHLQKFYAASHIVDLSSVKEMCNLVNLQYIEMFNDVEFPDIGRLTLLRELPTSLNVYTVRKKRGYEIHQLEKMNNIGNDKLKVQRRDFLRIQGLENVESKKDALQANLANKKYISRLVLDWGMVSGPISEDEGDRKSKKARRDSEQSSDPQDEILEALRPPSLVQDLTISNYNGSKYPSWLAGEKWVLNALVFEGCSGLKDPPSISMFNNLRSLEVRRCNWHSVPEDMDHLTSLKDLSIEFCENIRSLPRLPSSIENLTLTKWHGSDLPRAITECLYNLRRLNLWHCSLTSLPWDMVKLRSLRILGLYVCEAIMSLPALPSSLEELKLSGCSPSLEKHCLDDPILTDIVGFWYPSSEEDM